MSSVNTQSVRETVQQTKESFAELAASKKQTPEFKALVALFTSLLLIIDLLLAIFLEKKNPKTNKNSSIPSSQTSKDESSTSPNNKASNGKGHPENNATADNTTSKETVTISEVSFCTVCGTDLSHVECDHVERRTIIDIEFTKVVEHVDAEVKLCPECESSVKGDFPVGMAGPLQYGNGLKAFVINLLICQMVPMARTLKMLNAIICVLLSPATLLKFVMRLYEALELWEAQAKEFLLASLVMNVDETSLRVDKKNHWIHVHSAGHVTLKLLHLRRGKEAINDFNIIPRYQGVIIHDCWSSYFAYNNCEDGLCGSHLVRELTSAIESNAYRWAENMKALLLETCKKVSKRKRKKLSKREYVNLQKRYRNILTRGESELPTIPPKPHGKRGAMAKSDAHNLLARLIKYETAVLLFAKRSEVPFTNNRAERDLRMAKVKQKVSGCFRTEFYAKAYCRISSYIQTMIAKGYNPLIAIKLALDGDIKL
jgi:transposase